MAKKVKKMSEKLPAVFWYKFGTASDRRFLIENLAVLVSSGITVLEAFEVLGEDITSKKMKKLIQWMSNSMQDGKTLWKTLANTTLFGDEVVELVRIGEESGQLVENLQVISLQQEKDQLLKSKVKSAMMYPVFVFTLTLVVGTAVAWFVLPKLSTVFAQLDVKLPLITQYLIGTGEFLGAYGQFVVPAVLAAFFLLVFFVFLYKRTNYVGKGLMLMVPGIKNLLIEVEITRFGYLLGSLLQAGIPVTLAMESLQRATLIRRYKKFYKFLRDSFDEGNSFQKSFKIYKKTKKLFPGAVQHLITTAERSGNLADALTRVGANYEMKTETTTKNLTVLLEPVLLVIVWLGVLGVALSVVLPIYSLIGGFNVS